MAHDDIKALILAGGSGTRLRPLTYTRPKHLLPIANKPHIEHVFHLLHQHGIDQVVLLTSYMEKTFEEAVRAAKSEGMEVEILRERKQLGTAGALKNAERLLGDGTFLAFNGDILTDIDLNRVIDLHRERGAEATIVLTPVDDPSAFGVVPTDEDGRVLGFIEKPARDEAPTNFINAGIYVLERSVLSDIPRGSVWSAEWQLFPGLISRGARFFGVQTHAYWMDIGTPQKYLQANIDALLGRYQADLQSPALTPRPAIADEAMVSPDASIYLSAIGTGAVVADGASVDRSVLLPGAVVDERASVRGSVLGVGVRVVRGAHAINQTIADGHVVGLASAMATPA